MEKLLEGDKLSSELESVKKHIDLLASLKQKYPADYVAPLDHRPRRAHVVNTPVVEPPPPLTAEPTASSSDAIELILKSLKPSLTFTLSATPTATIASLKALLASQPGAPPADAQRWILKGKALADGKLLREYEIASGAVINLMIKAGAVAAPAAAAPGAVATVVTPPPVDPSAVPTFSLSEEVEDHAAPKGHGSKPSLSIKTSTLVAPSSPTIKPTPSPPDAAYSTLVSDPEVWREAWSLLKAKAAGEGGENAARRAWEEWLAASLSGISASDKAKIRAHVGLSSMGGE